MSEESLLVFTDLGGDQGPLADRGRKQSGPDAARVRQRRRLFGLPVRLHVRRGNQDGDTDGRELRRTPARRSDELPVSGRRRDRLPEGGGRRTVRDPQPERHDHLRLRIVVHVPEHGAVFVLPRFFVFPRRGRKRPLRRTNGPGGRAKVRADCALRCPPRQAAPASRRPTGTPPDAQCPQTLPKLKPPAASGCSRPRCWR